MFQNWLWPPVALALLAGWLPTTALLAAEYRSGDHVVVKADEVIEGDLYAVGQTIVIEGTVKGDLVAFGRDVTLKGVVEGDLIAAGRTVLIDGRVSDDVRIAGDILKFSKKGYVGGNVMAAGSSLECEAGSEVAGDVVFAGAQALLAGKIGRDLHGAMANCALHGEVGRDVFVESDGDGPISRWFDQWQQPPLPFPAPEVPAGFTVGPQAKVGGKLSYTALREAQIANPALAAKVEFHPIVVEAALPPMSKERIFGHLASGAPLVVFGLLAVLLMPRWMREMADTLRYRPLASFFGSFLGVIALLILIVLLLVVMGGVVALFSAAKWHLAAGGSAFLGLICTTALVIGWLCVVLVLAPAIASTAVGRLVTRSRRVPTIVSFLVGLVLLVVLTWIPIAGAILGGIALLLGTGAFCVWFLVGPPAESLEGAAGK